MYNEKISEIPINVFELEQEKVREGVFRSAYATDEAMFVMNVLAKGMDLYPHVHEDFDQLAIVTAGECDYYIEDVPHRLTAGSFLFVPAGKFHHAVPRSEVVHNMDVFFPSRPDFKHLLSYIEEL